MREREWSGAVESDPLILLGSVSNPCLHTESLLSSRSLGEGYRDNCIPAGAAGCRSCSGKKGSEEPVGRLESQ